MGAGEQQSGQGQLREGVGLVLQGLKGGEVAVAQRGLPGQAHPGGAIFGVQALRLQGGKRTGRVLGVDAGVLAELLKGLPEGGCRLRGVGALLAGGREGAAKADDEHKEGHQRRGLDG